MSGFTLLKGDCPVCSGTRKDCRLSNESGLIFCHYAEANPTGYIHRGTDSHGFGIWQANEDAKAFGSKSAQERKQEVERCLQQREREKQRRLAQELPAKERDRYYRQILSQLPLISEDRANLRARGLTDKQIEAKGYKSVDQWQKVKGDFPSNLPGLLPGNVLNSQPGILCPIWRSGLLVGFQGRKRNAGEKEDRYYCLSSRTKRNPLGASVHLKGEFPVTEEEPEEFKGNAIWACEGTGAKPDITRHRLGVPALGASGGLFYNSPTLTRESLERFTRKYQTKRIIIPPDKGDVVNKNKLVTHKKNVEFFHAEGYEVLFAWWGQTSKKGHQDIDELESYDNIQYIAPEQFFDIAAKVQSKESEKPESSVQPEERKSSAPYKQIRRAKLTYKPDLIVNQRYLTVTLPSKGLVVIQSPKDTGKSTLLARESKVKIEEGTRIINPTHRISLGRVLAGNLGLTWIDESNDSEVIFSRFLSLVVNSLHPYGKARFNYEDWEGAEAYIDEIEQFLRYLFSAKVLERQRSIVLQCFSKLINLVLETGGRIITLDADLSDLSLDYFQEVTNHKFKPYLIVNNYRHETFPVTAYTGKNPGLMFKELKRMISQGKRVLVLTDSQKETSIWGTFNIAQRLIKEIPAIEDKLIRIDAKTLADPNSNAYGCLDVSPKALSLSETVRVNPKKAFDNAIKKYQVVLASPSINTGLSIELYEHFDAVFLFSVGVLNAYDLHQFLWRLRDTKVRRHIWVKPKGMVLERGEIDAEKILDTKVKIVKHNISKITWSDPESIKLEDMVDLTNLRFWAKYVARDNASKLALREHLIAILNEEGCSLEACEEGRTKAERDRIAIESMTLHNKLYDVPSHQQKELEEKIKVLDAKHQQLSSKNQQLEAEGQKEREAQKTITEKSADQYYEDVSKAKDIGDTEAEALERSKTKTRDEELAVYKWKIKKKYKEVPVTKELAKDDNDPNYYGSLRTHYYATHAPAFLAMRDLRHLESRLNSLNGRKIEEFDFPLTLQDVRVMSSKVDLVKRLKLTEFLNGQYKESSKEMEAFLLLCKENRAEINLIFGEEIEEKTKPMRLLNNLLDKAFGLRLKRKNESRGQAKSQKRGKQYSAPQDERREAIFAEWRKEDEAKLREKGSELGAIAKHIAEEMGCSVPGEAIAWYESLAVVSPPSLAAEADAPPVEAEPIQLSLSLEKPSSKQQIHTSNRPEEAKQWKPLAALGAVVWIVRGRWKGFCGKVDQLFNGAIRCQIDAAGDRDWAELKAGDFTLDWAEFKRAIA